MKLRSTKEVFATKVVTIIKNLTSDRCSTHTKKINYLFIKYRMELLPQVTKNCHKLGLLCNPISDEVQRMTKECLE